MPNSGKNKNVVSSIVAAFRSQIPFLNRTNEEIIQRRQAIADFGEMVEAQVNSPEYQNTIGVILNKLKMRKERELYNPNNQSKDFNRDKAIGAISAYVEIQAEIDRVIAEGKEAIRLLNNKKGQTQ